MIPKAIGHLIEFVDGRSPLSRAFLHPFYLILLFWPGLVTYFLAYFGLYILHFPLYFELLISFIVAFLITRDSLFPFFFLILLFLRCFIALFSSYFLQYSFFTFGLAYQTLSCYILVILPFLVFFLYYFQGVRIISYLFTYLSLYITLIFIYFSIILFCTCLLIFPSCLTYILKSSLQGFCFLFNYPSLQTLIYCPFFTFPSWFTAQPTQPTLPFASLLQIDAVLLVFSPFYLNTLNFSSLLTFLPWFTTYWFSVMPLILHFHKRKLQYY